MTDTPRIEELRRRVEHDPASIAFAQLAEEYRRAGAFEDAVRVCEAGLARHPSYTSARVTLARALVELGRLEEAEAEFTRVLEAAPDNLVALGKLDEIRARLQTRQVPPGNTIPEISDVQAAEPEEANVTDPVVAELEAWLEVLAVRRRVRPSRF